ncbi:LUD domain-containing protein [Aequorivita marina]|uniref:LUD domain-containing protein n=1 Tax=Aequorivita marina TaxID=3073654 RepID=UPI0028767450|nr:LUD domain-containing protein [Aequorivita sp. S2608]MDS1298315.1 LUD domain-containing protein [Aequorivita sp. S2608]
MSLFKRLLFSNYKSDQKVKPTDDPDKSSFYPKDNLPIDEKFTYNFKNNGGKFIYCENWEEIIESFDNIMLENDWYEQDVFCINEQLKQRFEGFNLNFVKNSNTRFFLSTCEALVANNGSILLSSNQVKEKKLREFPSNFIIFATTSQMVDTISEGLRTINNQSSGYIPSNITTIQNFEIEKEKNFMSYGSSTKNLYLLLLEDL